MDWSVLDNCVTALYGTNNAQQAQGLIRNLFPNNPLLVVDSCEVEALSIQMNANNVPFGIHVSVAGNSLVLVFYYQRQRLATLNIQNQERTQAKFFFEFVKDFLDNYEADRDNVISFLRIMPPMNPGIPYEELKRDVPHSTILDESCEHHVIRQFMLDTLYNLCSGQEPYIPVMRDDFPSFDNKGYDSVGDPDPDEF